jgi:DGQHR domain-containing protein
VPRRKKIVRRALRLNQSEKHPIFQFSLTGDELNSIADVSRISRGKSGKLLGYQRPEVKRHIQEIADYLDGDDVVFPNPIIVAIPSSTIFRASRGVGSSDGISTVGNLELRLPAGNEKKTAWIVDGQQRAMALVKCKRQDMAVPVNAFIADSLELQRDQFLRINNSKPLPRGLITELLPEVSTTLPARLNVRKIPSALCDLLNQHPESPMKGLIRRASTTKEEKKHAVIADASIVTMLENSISEPSGCLFPYRNIATGETDFESIQSLLFAYWGATRDAFPKAWGRPPKESRLMHGAGVRAMGKLMDRVMSHANPHDKKLAAYVKKELRPIVPLCHWTSGKWPELGGMQWNEIQNVPRHINLLSNYLVRAYLNGRGTRR